MDTDADTGGSQESFAESEHGAEHASSARIFGPNWRWGLVRCELLRNRPSLLDCPDRTVPAVR